MPIKPLKPKPVVDDFSFQQDNAFIVLEAKEDTECRGIYCAKKGNPAHTGNTLLKRYKVRHKIEALINLGDIQSLEWGIGPDIARTDMANQPPSIVAFARDLGHTLRIGEFSDSGYAKHHAINADIRWFYLFSQGRWHVGDLREGDKMRRLNITTLSQG